jgi:nucleoside 2-deoxyribosyltransferase
MKIYFAHPAFNDRQRAVKTRFLEKLRAGLTKVCTEKNLPIPEIMDPFDYAPDIEGNVEHRDSLERAVSSICLWLLTQCSLVLALADDGDTGVAFELGYANALHIPVILVSEGEAADTANAMLKGTAQACIADILDDQKMALLIDLIYGFLVSEESLIPSL